MSILLLACSPKGLKGAKGVQATLSPLPKMLGLAKENKRKRKDLVKNTSSTAITIWVPILCASFISSDYTSKEVVEAGSWRAGWNRSMRTAWVSEEQSAKPSEFVQSNVSIKVLTPMLSWETDFLRPENKGVQAFKRH